MRGAPLACVVQLNFLVELGIFKLRIGEAVIRKTLTPYSLYTLVILFSFSNNYCTIPSAYGHSYGARGALPPGQQRQ